MARRNDEAIRREMLKNNLALATLFSGWLHCACLPAGRFAMTGNFITFSNISIMEYGGCVYIMTNFHNTVLYTGVTSNLPQRVYQHKTKQFKTSFTAKYNCDKLVWFESFSRIEDAIAREKQLKAGNRKRKEDLNHAINPHWNDLWEDVKMW